MVTAMVIAVGRKGTDWAEWGKEEGGGAERSEVVNELLCRTWDIVDSHVFQSIFSEAINTSFKHVNSTLPRTFSADSSLQAGELYRTLH